MLDTVCAPNGFLSVRLGFGSGANRWIAKQLLGSTSYLVVSHVDLFHHDQSSGRMV